MAAITGCGGPALVPAGGKVTLNGQPIKGEVSILFQPESGQDDFKAGAAVRSDGSFTLRTIGIGEGVLPGKYRVAVNQDPADARQDKSSPFLSKYAFAKSSPITVEIPREGKTDIDIRLPLK